MLGAGGAASGGRRLATVARSGKRRSPGLRGVGRDASCHGPCAAAEEAFTEGLAARQAEAVGRRLARWSVVGSGPRPGFATSEWPGLRVDG